MPGVYLTDAEQPIKVPKKNAQSSGGCNLKNAECRTQLQFTRSAKVHPFKNKPKPYIVNHKPYPNPKITQRERMESFYGRDYRKVDKKSKYAFQLTYYIVVAFCIQHSLNYTRLQSSVCFGSDSVTARAPF